MSSGSGLWTPREQAAWRLPEDITVSDWADQHRILDGMTSAEPGQWHTDRTPYLREPQDCFADPVVEECTLVFGTQCGKSELLNNTLAYAIDQDPGPGMFVYPTKEKAEEISEKRIQPMIQLSPTLASHMTSKAWDMKTASYRLDRMLVHFCGAKSPSDLAAWPVRFLWMDETDKFPRWSGTEADPIDLAKERTTTYWNRKIWKASTCTTEYGYIWREFLRSDMRRYWVPCHKCGRFQFMTWGQVRVPKDERDWRKIKDQNLAWYACIHCKGKWLDHHKTEAIQGGIWVPEGIKVNSKGKLTKQPPPVPHRGYHLNGLYSPWRTFSEIASKFFETRNDPPKFQNFWNSWMAEPWQERLHETDRDKVAQKATDIPAGAVPESAYVLTAGVDVQRDYLRYVIRAWGLRQESWMIREGAVGDWAQLAAELFQTEYAKESGDVFTVMRAAIDARHRSDEVYEFCAHDEWAGLATPIMGMGSAQVRIPLSEVRIDHRKRRGSRQKTRFNVNVDFFKDKLQRFMGAQAGDVGAWHLHQDPSDVYLTEICNEKKAIKRNRTTGQGTPEWITTGPNHGFDCEVYNLVAAQLIGVQQLREQDVKQRHQVEPSRREKESGGNWNKRGRGWWSG